MHWLILPLLFLCWPALAQERPLLKQGDLAALTAYLQEYVEEQRDDADVPGLAVALVKGDRLLWQAGFGWLDESEERRVNADTVFRTGSITTLLTATLILQFVAEGKLELDQPVTRYLPQFSMQGMQKVPTLRQLLNHHAGLPMAHFHQMWGESVPRFDGVLDLLREQSPSFPPDTIFAFSNLAYDVLGMVIEKVCAQPFETCMRRRVFEPLRMTRSAFTPPSVMAQPHKGEERKPLLAVRDTPALGLFSSVADLARFCQALLAPARAPLTPAMVEEMLRRQNDHVELDLGRGAALAWQHTDLGLQQKGPVLIRTASSLFYRAMIAMLPQQDLAVVVLANSSRAMPPLQNITREALAMALYYQTGVAPPAADLEPVLPLPQGANDTFADGYASLIGFLSLDKPTVADVMGWDFELKREVSWYRPRLSLFGLIPISMDWLGHIRVAPRKLAGRRVLVGLYHGQAYLFGEYLPRMSLTAAWRKRLGEYELAERDVLLDNLKLEEGKLVFDKGRLFFRTQLPTWFPLTLNVPLKVVDDKTLVIAGLGSALGETIRVQNVQGRDYLIYSGYRLRPKRPRSHLQTILE